MYKITEQDYFRDDDNFLTVKVPLEILRKYCLWIIAKYKMDQFHQQQNSSRRDLLGGFMDRWLNRIPEYLIFDALLNELSDNNKLKIVNDNFFYNKESAKNAPDILGLVKNDDFKEKYYPFTKFNNNQWTFTKNNAPFIEMKTFRKSQKLITIPCNQFNQVNIDCFYAIVISYINDNYLLYLLDKNIFKNFEFVSNKEFIKSNHANILKYPNKIIESKINEYEKLIKNPNIGCYKLMGVYDSDTISNYSIIASTNDEKKPEKPRYLYSIDEVDNKNINEVNYQEFEYFMDAFGSIPLLFDISKDSVVHLLVNNEFHDIILVSGEVKIYDINGILIDILNDGCHKLNFESFIYNLKKYYHFISFDKKIEYSIEEPFEIIELRSGIYFHYEDNIVNNHFNLNKLFDANFEVFDYSNSTLCFKVHKDVNNKVKKGFNKYEFKSNGYLIPEDNFQIDEITKFKLPEKNSPENFSLKLYFDVSNDSKLKFIKRNKTSFKMCFKGDAKVYENKDNKFSIEEDGQYEFKIYDGTCRKNNPGFDLRKPEIIYSDSDDSKLYIKTLELDENGFYYPDKFNKDVKEENKNNVKFKVDCSEGMINVIEIGKSKEEKYETYYKINVTDKVIIDGTTLEDYSSCPKKIWKLSFDTFERTSKKDEYILSKGSLSYFGKSLEKDLIKRFEDFMDDEDSQK